MSEPDHAANLRERTRRAVADERVIRAVRLATFRKVDQRAAGLAALHDAEALRTLAAEIKRHTLAHLPHYLEQFIRGAERRGARVHLAPDAAAARRIVTQIAVAAGAALAVKVKSMTTEEVHLNEQLAAAGVRVVETDLGEFIVQLDRDRPSHIVTPIIHKDRKQVAAALQRELGLPYTEDPAALTQMARGYLRDVFRRADLGISGVNFSIAESGALCICTNEGNGRMCVSRPRVHVALMGIEKLIPRRADLAVFLKLLSRSSTGQPMTVYTTLMNGPRRAEEPDGPTELHIILLDNGRAALLGGEFEDVLRCIRCGACLNACPVYRNVGGHAYASVYPGPIGALVTPLLNLTPGAAELPRASSLCGACETACPVKIPIPELLVRLRERHADRQPLTKRLALRAFATIMQSRSGYVAGQRLLRWSLARRADGFVRSGLGPLAEWLRTRDLPAPAAQTFRELWRAGLAAEPASPEAAR